MAASKVGLVGSNPDRRCACWWHGVGPAWAAGDDSRSTNIALNRSGNALFVANREADSLTVFAVDGGHNKAAKGNGNILTKLDEVAVGEEPVCVAVRGQRAFVANAVSGTVSVVEWTGVGFGETAEFDVGTEPRGCALSGTRLFVTNFTEGTVTIVDTTDGEIVDRVEVGGNPYGITVVGNDVFVTQFFARLIDGGPGEGFDDGKEGVVQHFRRNNFNLDEITLAPLADSGFIANRVNLCQQFNPLAPNNTFCPDPNATDPNDPVIAQAVAGVFPNQLKTALACDGLLYLPNVGAQPEPPVAAGVNFNTNVQALVHVVDIASKTERQDLTVNLNQQIATEPDAGPGAGEPRQAVRQRDRGDGRGPRLRELLHRQPRRQLRAQGAARALTASSTSAPRTTSSASRRATSRPASWWTKRASWASSTTR